MVSRSEPCAIAIAKELWEAIRPILIKHGSTPAEVKNVHGIMIVAYTNLERSQVSMLGMCNASATLRFLMKELVREGRGVILPFG